MPGTMTILFEGFWQCRMSTDPDPTLEGRGTSGYTIALPREGDFDRVIRTQRDQIPDHELRQPFPPYLVTLADDSPRPFGVTVTRVEGAPDPAIGLLLQGAEFRLMGSPRFELRNQIVGDGINRIAPAIVPFDVQIGRMDEVYLRRFDPLDPSRPDVEIWQLAPNDFAPRAPVTYRHLSDEVVETIFPAEPRAGNANSLFTGYFNQRKQLVSLWLSDPGLDPLTAAGYRAGPGARCLHESERRPGSRPHRGPARASVHLGPSDPRPGRQRGQTGRPVRGREAGLAHALLDGRVGR